MKVVRGPEQEVEANLPPRFPSDDHAQQKEASKSLSSVGLASGQPSSLCSNLLDAPRPPHLVGDPPVWAICCISREAGPCVRSLPKSMRALTRTEIPGPGFSRAPDEGDWASAKRLERLSSNPLVQALAGPARGGDLGLAMGLRLHLGHDAAIALTEEPIRTYVRRRLRGCVQQIAWG